MGKLKDIRERVGSLDAVKDPATWCALAAEALGTLLLVLIGCGSCTTWNGIPATVVQISLAFGIAVASLAQAIGHVSGCHINPGVTIGMLVTGKIIIVKGLLYILAQIVGGITGAALLKAVTPEEVQNNLGLASLGVNVTPVQGFGVEFFITFVLVLVVFGVTDSNRNDITGSAPLAIGLTVSAAHLLAVKFTGSGMNPARALGPALLTGMWDNHWLYWVGPLSGGAAAALLYQYGFSARGVVREEEIDEEIAADVKGKSSDDTTPV